MQAHLKRHPWPAFMLRVACVRSKRQDRCGYGSNLLFSFSEYTCTWTKTVHHLGFARSGEIEEWLNLSLYDSDGIMSCGLQDLLLNRCFKEYVSRYELTFATFLSSADTMCMCCKIKTYACTISCIISWITSCVFSAVWRNASDWNADTADAKCESNGSWQLRYKDNK